MEPAKEYLLTSMGTPTGAGPGDGFLLEVIPAFQRPVYPPGTSASRGNGLSSGASANRIAHYNSLVVDFNGPAMGSGFNSTVRAIERFNNVIYAAGDFTASGDNATTLSHIASWNGSAWVQLGSGINGTVNALRAYNGFLYAGGSFTSAAGLSSGGLARWNGTAWSIVGGYFLGTVYSLELYNNQLVIAGDYAGIGQCSQNLAQYNKGRAHPRAFWLQGEQTRPSAVRASDPMATCTSGGTSRARAD